MSKNKILRVILPIVAAVIVVCVLCILLLKQCRSEKDVPADGPTSEITSSTAVDDVEFSNREDFDWRSEAGESHSKDDAFNSISNESQPSNNSDSSKENDNGTGLRYDESKNQGQEADFSSWNTAQP